MKMELFVVTFSSCRHFFFFHVDFFFFFCFKFFFLTSLVSSRENRAKEPQAVAEHLFRPPA
jgi:hypothetical protein